MWLTLLIDSNGVVFSNLTFPINCFKMPSLRVLVSIFQISI